MRLTISRSRRRGIALLLLSTVGACAVPDDGIEEQPGALRPENDPNDPGLSQGEKDEILAMNNAGWRARNEYLSKKYPNERGQSDNWKKTLYAGLIDIFNTAKNDGGFEREYCSQFYTDKYGFFYYTAPIRGEKNPDGSHYCETDSKDILRPEWKGLKAYAHSHPWADGVRSRDDETMAGQLLRQDPKFEFWTIKSNGELYVYVKGADGKPAPKFFGKIDKGHVITAYNDLNDVHRPGFDPYAPQPEDSGGGIWSSVWKGLVAAWAVSGAVAAAILGGASTPSDGCCAGPPASGYDPASDPTQVCRRADGSSCT